MPELLLILPALAIFYLLGRESGREQLRDQADDEQSALKRYRDALDDLDRWCGHSSPHARVIQRHLVAHGEGLLLNAGTPVGDEACTVSGLREQLQRLDDAVLTFARQSVATEDALLAALATRPAIASTDETPQGPAGAPITSQGA